MAKGMMVTEFRKVSPHREAAWVLLCFSVLWSPFSPISSPKKEKKNK